MLRNKLFQYLTNKQVKFIQYDVFFIDFKMASWNTGFLCCMHPVNNLDLFWHIFLYLHVKEANCRFIFHIKCCTMFMYLLKFKLSIIFILCFETLTYTYMLSFIWEHNNEHIVDTRQISLGFCLYISRSWLVLLYAYKEAHDSVIHKSNQENLHLYASNFHVAKKMFFTSKWINKSTNKDSY